MTQKLLPLWNWCFNLGQMQSADIDVRQWKMLSLNIEKQERKLQVVLRNEASLTKIPSQHGPWSAWSKPCMCLGRKGTVQWQCGLSSEHVDRTALSCRPNSKETQTVRWREGLCDGNADTRVVPHFLRENAGQLIKRSWLQSLPVLNGGQWVSFDCARVLPQHVGTQGCLDFFSYNPSLYPFVARVAHHQKISVPRGDVSAG